MRYSRNLVVLIILIMFVILGSSGIVFNNSLSNSRVIISIDRSILYLNNTKLTGFIFIAMVTPKNLYSYGYPVENSKTVVVSFSRAIEDWSQFYSKELYKLRSEGEVPLPTIYVTLFLYDEKGYEYIVTYSYSTVTYFLKKGMSIFKAVSQAIKDPLALFREPIYITLRKNLEGISITRLDISKSLEYVKQIITFRNSNHSHSENQAISTYSCIPMFLEVYWDDLYNSIGNPPKGWMERIQGLVTDSMKKELWNYYAYYASQSYYFRKDLYTLTDALLYVYQKLIAPGAYTMDMFLHALAERKGYIAMDISWDHVYKPGMEFSIDVPMLGIEMHYYESEPIEAIGTITKFVYNEYKSGIAFLGKIFMGTSISTTTFEEKAILLDRNTPSLIFIMVPTTYRYVGDGFFINYDVDTKIVNGCEYWVITPMSTPFMPYYIKIASDLRNAYTHIGEPSSYSDLVWSYSITQIYSDLVTNENTVTYEPFFTDTNVHTSLQDYSVAGAVFSLSKGFVDTLISIILRGHPITSLVYAIVSSFFSYAEVNIEITATALFLKLYRADTLSQSVYVFVNKLTLVDRSAAEPYTPLMSKYIVIVS